MKGKGRGRKAAASPPLYRTWGEPPMTNVRLEVHSRGVVLPVRAQPGARREGLAGVHDGALKVAVTAAAEKGRANQAIVAVLAAALGLKKSQIELISGETARRKLFLVDGLSMDDLCQRISLALNKSK